MSFMRGDLLTRTRKLVKGMAMAEPSWLKAMEQAPPATFPRFDGKLKKITLPEDPYIKKFFQLHSESLYQDAIKISSFDHPPARIFGQRVVELKEQGFKEDDAMALADKEYQAEMKMKKKAYARLKQNCRAQGKRLPPNPFPSPIKEIQAEEKKYVYARFNDPSVRQILNRMKQEKAAQELERQQSGGW